MSDKLRSAAPDPAAMRARLDDAVWRWLSGHDLTPSQQRIVDMHMRPGGCPSC